MRALIEFIKQAGLANVEALESPFTYLAGPMTRKPWYNFLEFDRVASNLRIVGMAIISPAELDDQATREFVLTKCPTGTEFAGKSHADCLRRDGLILLHPNCQGVVVLPGWEHSSGAGMETFIAETLNLPIDRYQDEVTGHSLRRIDRATALRWAGARCV